MMRRVFIPCAALLLASFASPAMAWECWHGWDGCPDATRHAMYELRNSIALLEADPVVDDGYKAPIITSARDEIFRLRATLVPAQWRWTTPCCYSRPPIRIRWVSHRRGAH